MNLRAGELNAINVVSSVSQVVLSQLLTLHVFMLFLRIQRHVLSFHPNMLSSNVDSDSALIPRKPSTSTICSCSYHVNRKNSFAMYC